MNKMTRHLGAGIHLWRWPAMLTGEDRSELLVFQDTYFAMLIKRTTIGLLIRGRTRWIIIRW